MPVRGAGTRNRRVTIKRLVETRGQSREPIEDFSNTLCTLYAKREDVDAPERFTEGVVLDQMSARAWMKWTIPYRTDMDPLKVQVPKERRLEFDGRVYDIAGATLNETARGAIEIVLLTLTKAG